VYAQTKQKYGYTVCTSEVAGSSAIRTILSEKDFLCSSQGSIMSVMSIVDTAPALLAGQNDAEDMPSTMPFMCMASTTAAISIILVGTDVLASVSLFVVVLSVSLLVSLVLIGLTLSGLTGLLISLVGLVTEVDISKKQGD
jgi:hypothetical protein